MNSLRTVTLELLRHGPPHNQLLSPLTQYLALCGNHPAVTVTMPFEHNQLLVRLNALKYKDSDETWKLQLKDTAQLMGEILGRVPGLIAELAEGGGVPGQTHLRLILSASELALLPFELANAPNGFPGAGQPLALQAQAPLCITREVRRVSKAHYAWPRKPRILVIAAAPPGVGAIPLEAHLLALRRVIDPWVEPPPTGTESPQTLQRRLAPHLTVLPAATVSEIRRACAEQDFTHVHVLAHGISIPGEEKRYGVALHDDFDPAGKDVVDGARLATVLRTYSANTEAGRSRPAVVTLAVCQGGDQGGSVVGAGASIAHALHEGGIPFVVAAQFPLSFPASVMMAEVMYEGLLWGADPRRVLNDLRAQMRSRLPERHDWASLVAYAALPADLPDQLLKVRLAQVRRSSGRAMLFVDRLVKELAPRYEDEESRAPDREEFRRRMDDAMRVFGGVRTHLRRLLEDVPEDKGSERARICGFLASVDKREGQTLVLYNKWFRKSAEVYDWEQQPGASHEAASRCFANARENHRRAFAADPSLLWTLVQQLSLGAVLGGASVWSSDAWRDTWITARVLSERQLSLDNPTENIQGAHSNLIELYLLAELNAGLVRPQVAAQKAAQHAEQFASGGTPPHVISAVRRRIERYVDCFPYYNADFTLDVRSRVKASAEAILAKLTQQESQVD